MANGCAQVFGCLLATLGLTCLIIATTVNEWKTDRHTDDGKVRSQIKNVGLWMECRSDPGREECDIFDSLLHQTTEIQVTRAMMILSMALSVCGLVTAILGMKSTLCLEADEQVKNKVAFAGGMLLIFSGVCALGIVSWYAHGVITSFHDSNPRAPRFSLGKCLFLGWGGALLSIIGGVFLACCSLSKSSPHRAYASPMPVQPLSGKEYV
ncbi:hypothetical protein ACEWY4_015048 [Coilia grayii]|uniref:Claudin n=1 Tax=Coilia grayii TaxID=363190 RepID=A0ABD1JU61_9TELE